MIEKKEPAAPRTRRKRPQSQLIDLFLHVAEELGFASDKEIANLAGVSVENVANWKSGSVKEFKPKKLEGIKNNLAAHITALREEAGQRSGASKENLAPLEIESGANPAELQRQFRTRVTYDYLGHRFLYYESGGALAWQNLVKRGYEQDYWLAGVEQCTQLWMDTKKNEIGQPKGVIANVLGFGKRGPSQGVDVITLGPGEGDKETLLIKNLLGVASTVDQGLSWLTYMPVDVSISLLLTAAQSARRMMAEAAEPTLRPIHQVKPICADFEEGPLTWLQRLPTTTHVDQPGRRLVLMLGNVFGNLRDEEMYVRHKLWEMVRPQDLVWIEVGLRLDPLEKDPLFRMTDPHHEESATEANRRLLLEGPYRRWEAATGRRPSTLQMRIWVREDDDSCRIPGSCNFCHDLVIEEERRACTMLYSRRYQLEPLVAWFERQDFNILGIQQVKDSQNRSFVVHLLMQRK